MVRDRFETDSINVMKKTTCSKETNAISIFIDLAQSYQKTMKIVTRNKNKQGVCKAILVCDKFLRNMKTSKCIGLMLLVIYNNVIKSS